MKLLVIGCGSIGRRHAANAAQLGALGVFDADASAAQATAREHGGLAFSSLEAALEWHPAAAVVATPHRFHIAQARQVVEAGVDVLIEKPLSHTPDGVDDFLSLVEARRRRAFVVCNMRFHPGPATLQQNITRVGQPLFARAHVGNFLPSMRPGRDYRELYAAHRSQGGGVILDAVHEIDYLSWLLGPVSSVGCHAQKLSLLDIDVEDHALLAIEHTGGARASAELDYLRPRKSRGCEIIGTDGVLLWWSDSKAPEACSVRFCSPGGDWETLFESAGIDMAEPYRAMMAAFVEEIALPGSTKLLNAADAAHVLRVAHAALESAAAKGVTQNVSQGRVPA